MVEQNYRYDPAWQLRIQGKTFILDKQPGNSQIQVLAIDRTSLKLSEKDKSSINWVGKEMYIYGIFGILNIIEENYLVVITKRHSIGSISSHHVYQIQSVKLIPFLDTKKSGEINAIVKKIQKIMKVGFYYSYTYDLTSSRQKQGRQKEHKIDEHSGEMSQKEYDQTNYDRTEFSQPPIQRADSRYLWNFSYCSDILHQQVSSSWAFPIIQGFCRFHNEEIDDMMSLCLISRRQHLRAGTRFNSRGINDEGYVSNFVETEFIISFRERSFSYLQIRGSIPVFWEQTKVNDVTITKNQELTMPAFERHATILQEEYHSVFFLNLLKIANKNEDLLTKEFEIQFAKYQTAKGKEGIHTDIKYEQFDFHALCKGEKLDKFDLFLQKEEMEKIFLDEKWCREATEKFPTGWQRGIIRTNCLDCLDRTNIVQMKIAEKVFFSLLQSMINERLCRTLLGTEVKGLIKGFKKIWALNGDAISQEYTGTDAITTQLIKDGKKSFFGNIKHGFTSSKRFLNNTFGSDDKKQTCIDVILGRHSKSMLSGVPALVEMDLKEREGEYTIKSSILLSVCTWNLAGVEPTDTNEQEVEANLFSDHKNDNYHADIYILGFQEVIPLNTKSIMASAVASTNAIGDKWQHIILSILSKYGNYQCYKTKKMVGLYIAFFARTELKYKIHAIKATNVKTGMMGKIGNKGAVIIRFEIEDSSFCFVNCHLASGHKKVNERIAHLKEIYEKAFTNDVRTNKKDYLIENHDIQYIFGDLNFRINLDNAFCRKSANENNLKTLIAEDQLNKLFLTPAVILTKQTFGGNIQWPLLPGFMHGFEEAIIKFKPTYKFDKNSNTYDTSKKNRIPGYCDRILWKSDNRVICHLYDSSQDALLSDHRPVFGIYEIIVSTVDDSKRKHIEDKLYERVRRLPTMKVQKLTSNPGLQIPKSPKDKKGPKDEGGTYTLKGAKMIEEEKEYSNQMKLAMEIDSFVEFDNYSSEDEELWDVDPLNEIEEQNEEDFEDEEKLRVDSYFDSEDLERSGKKTASDEIQPGKKMMRQTISLSYRSYYNMIKRAPTITHIDEITKSKTKPSNTGQFKRF